MDLPRWRMWRLLKDVPFWIGVAFGLLVVLPQVLLRYGIGDGRIGEPWVAMPGFVAEIFMLVGIFCWDAKYVYAAMTLGVLANGLFWALVGYAIRERVARARAARGPANP